MKIHYQPFAAALSIAVAPWMACAQISAAAPQPAALAASAPLATAKPAIVTKTPGDKRDRADAAVANENRPDRPVTSQLSIPLGKKPDSNSRTKIRKSPYGNPSASGGVDDSAAACLTKADAAARAACQAQLPKDPTPR